MPSPSIGKHPNQPMPKHINQTKIFIFNANLDNVQIYVDPSCLPFLSIGKDKENMSEEIVRSAFGFIARLSYHISLGCQIPGKDLGNK